MLRLDEAFNALEVAADAKYPFPHSESASVNMMNAVLACFLYFLLIVWSSNWVAARISRRLRYQRRTTYGRVALHARSIYRRKAVD